MNETLAIHQSDKELEVLRSIYHNDAVRQRDLAEIAGLSLGMTNAIMKRLALKGFLTVRKVNNRNIMYAVSPSGVEELSKRSYKYFKRTIKNIVYYKEGIEDLILHIRREGFGAVALVGDSDVDFIVEHLCHKYGLAYSHRKDGGENKDGAFMLYAESRRENEARGTAVPGEKSLRDILIPV
jgi:DNA-binding MarR family transcriptional regulator